ncbi:VP1 [Zetapolyomavirus delphini]|uniref:VP1 n=1 Tax=Zetapolyomavirus delphini TaxID=1891756 RepID=S5M435_9POLY|nr:VP1 [Zetapolyomavirus delphini]AGR44739.1 VP1 [Zetapolyomavirus delphini]
MSARKGRGAVRPPSQVPKLIVKGGVEVLGVKTGPDSILYVECYLQPRMGDPATNGASSGQLTRNSTNETDNETQQGTRLARYSCGSIQLPLLNDDMTQGTILMWEAFEVKTELVGINVLTNFHSAEDLAWPDGPGLPIQGLNFHMFAVGGQPLELQGILMNHLTTYPDDVVVPNRTNKTPSLKVLDPTAKSQLTEDGKFPIECWAPDPSKNENTRYFCSLTGGTQTPPVLQQTNTVTTVLLDANGVGPLCKGDRLFVTSADIIGIHKDASHHAFLRGLPRFFRVGLRKRTVKNPYPVYSMLNSLFTNLNPSITGQSMQGANSQVEEVSVYQGTEPLPADPDMTRFINEFGQETTSLPH